MEQAVGQLKVMHNRRPISVVLRRRDLTEEQRGKLQMVLMVRRYAHEEIGLRRTGAYTTFFDTGGKPLAYNLSACSKDSLKPRVWRFPIVGGLPYIGFFDHQRGLEQQRILDEQGLDTYLRPVPAFSSLGWFADPVYSPMLERDLPRLLDVVIHETTHTTIFIRDQVAFNESLAVFVGNQGTLNFLARVYGPTSPMVQQYGERIARRRRFSKLVSELYRRLDRLFRSRASRSEKLAGREVLYAWAKRRYKELFPDPSTWGRFVKQPLNNAVLLSYGRYNQGLKFHHRVYRALGRDLKRMVALYRRAQRFSDPMDYVARATGVPPFDLPRM